MFTGIIQSLGEVVKRERGRLTLKVGRLPLKIGDSVAVDGVCLTVTALSGASRRRCAAFDLSQETLDKTTLGKMTPGQKVNLEPALRAGDPLGGHFVLGHVEAVGEILSKTPGDGWALFEFSFPAALGRYLAPKGSVAVDGVSLTVVDLKDRSFTVAVIPHTEKNTGLGSKAPGDPVNLETDILAKHVEKLLRAPKNAGEGGLFVKKTLSWEEAGTLLEEDR